MDQGAIPVSLCDRIAYNDTPTCRSVCGLAEMSISLRCNTEREETYAFLHESVIWDESVHTELAGGSSRQKLTGSILSQQMIQSLTLLTAQKGVSGLAQGDSNHVPPSLENRRIRDEQNTIEQVPSLKRRALSPYTASAWSCVMPE